MISQWTGSKQSGHGPGELEQATSVQVQNAAPWCPDLSYCRSNMGSWHSMARSIGHGAASIWWDNFWIIIFRGPRLDMKELQRLENQFLQAVVASAIIEGHTFWHHVLSEIRALKRRVWMWLGPMDSITKSLVLELHAPQFWTLTPLPLLSLLVLIIFVMDVSGFSQNRVTVQLAISCDGTWLEKKMPCYSQFHSWIVFWLERMAWVKKHSWLSEWWVSCFFDGFWLANALGSRQKNRITFFLKTNHLGLKFFDALQIEKPCWRHQNIEGSYRVQLALHFLMGCALKNALGSCQKLNLPLQ